MPSPADSVKRIRDLDISLFAAISSQTGPDDRKSLLAVQTALADALPQYAYLEIGSHLGGSIQPHLVDPRCRTIYSIDKRPLIQPDDRGQNYEYPDNSSARMMSNLRALSESECAKIRVFDQDARDVPATEIVPRPDLCFIDGEHTVAAVLSDFNFCLSVVAPNGVILFHDASFLFDAFVRIERQLKKRQIPFFSGLLFGNVYMIALRAAPVRKHPLISQMLEARRAFSEARRREANCPAPLRPLRKFVSRWVQTAATNSVHKPLVGVVPASSEWTDAVFEAPVGATPETLVLSTRGVEGDWGFRIALVGDSGYESEYWVDAHGDITRMIEIGEFSVRKIDKDLRFRKVYVGGPRSANSVEVQLKFA